MKPVDGVPGIAGVAVGGVRPDRAGEPLLQPPGTAGGLPLPWMQASWRLNSRPPASISVSPLP